MNGDAIVTWNVENWVTITLMTAIGFTVYHMAMKHLSNLEA